MLKVLSTVRGEAASHTEVKDAQVRVGSHTLKLSNLSKVFFPQQGLTKADLIRYYVEMAPALLPHLRGRAMVMKRYPNGVTGDSFYMKRTPDPHPDFIHTCAIEHSSGKVIDFPVVNDEETLVWLVNLGCIDLHPWYARCDDVDRPDHLHFDLDPGTAPWRDVVKAGFIVKDALDGLQMPNVVKTSGSKGLHVYVPIQRGPTQKQVWSVSKTLAWELAKRHPKLLTAEYKISKRPPKRVLVDYNQNAWGRTLASVYSVRPREAATVSAPLTWKELEDGAEIDDFTLHNMPARVKKKGDLWAPVMASAAGRFHLAKFL